jgi:hypothetical protein
LARKADVSRTTASTTVSEPTARVLVVEANEEPGEDLDRQAGNRLSINPRTAVAAGPNHTFDGGWVQLSDLAPREVASSGAALDPGTPAAERGAAGASIRRHSDGRRDHGGYPPGRDLASRRGGPSPNAEPSEALSTREHQVTGYG